MHSIRGTSFIPNSRKKIECKTKVELGNRFEGKRDISYYKKKR